MSVGEVEEERGAKVLLLSVAIDVATAFFLAECRGPDRLIDDNSFAVMTKKGREWLQ